MNFNNITLYLRHKICHLSTSIQNTFCHLLPCQSCLLDTQEEAAHHLVSLNKSYIA